jgi:hypothetical protein
MRRDVRLDELRLVLPIRDPQTNELKDIILNRMDLQEVLVPAPGKCAEIKPTHRTLTTIDGEMIKRESDKAYELEDYKWKTLRYVPGTKTEIVDHSDKDDHDWDKEYGPNDTVLISVEEQTYWPELTKDPMPPSVLKEITFRDRKEITKYSDTIEEAIKERAEAKARKQFELEDRIRTPLQELKLELKKVQREARRERQAEFEGGASKTAVTAQESGEGVATPKPLSDIMVTIGQAMARNWAENPHVVTGGRRKLLEKVLEQEGAVVETAPEACV